MSQPNILVENLSKRYQLGTIGYGSLQQDLSGWWAKVRGKQDPNSKIGEGSRLGLHGEFWALRNIDFEVHPGDRVGIIGRNGAGKSTLLKLLSRVTSPTAGTIRVQGRIASLLEVGTGFHPELTGRENVFLNGAILGMKRKEIQSKFDEIVAFSGVEQFIDTPVKRYSSGMYVRLAFSVAAHLDSDILILDEVLAVGDAEFQKKCLAKMQDVSVNHGKTILLVSHYIQSILNLCNKGLLLSDGRVVERGNIQDVALKYRPEKELHGQVSGLRWSDSPSEDRDQRDAEISEFAIEDANGNPVKSILMPGQKYYLAIELQVHRFREELSLFVGLYSGGQLVFAQDCSETPEALHGIRSVGKKRVLFEIPTEILLDKEYEIEASLVLHGTVWILPPKGGQGLTFTNVRDARHPLGFDLVNHPYSGAADPSFIRAKTSWTISPH